MGGTDGVNALIAGIGEVVTGGNVDVSVDSGDYGDYGDFEGGDSNREPIQLEISLA